MGSRSATEKTCLLVFFWGGLAEPLRARMPYWNPEESLEGYLNLALRLSGSAFRVESAAEPVRDSSQAAASAPKAPEAVVPAHTAHEAPNAAMPAHTASESGGARSHSSRSSSHNDARPHSIRSGGSRPHSSRSS